MLLYGVLMPCCINSIVHHQARIQLSNMLCCHAFVFTYADEVMNHESPLRLRETIAEKSYVEILEKRTGRPVRCL